MNCKTEFGQSYDPRSGETLSNVCSSKYSVVEIFVLVQNLMKKIDDKKYNNYMFTLTYIALVSISPLTVVDGGGVLVGDLGDVGEPRDNVEEGEELPVGDRIESEQTSFSV